MSTRNRLYLIILFVAGLVVAGSVIRFLHQRSLRAVGSGLRVEEAVAFKFGRLIRDRLPGNGPVLVVQLPALNTGTAERAKLRLAAFVRGLDVPEKSVIVASPSQLPTAAILDLGGRMYSGQWSKELLAWIAPYPQARAVMSFMDFPDDLPAQLPQPWPPVLAVYVGGDHPAADLVQQGKAFALAELRPTAPLQVEPGFNESVNSIFDARYTLVVTP